MRLHQCRSIFNVSIGTPWLRGATVSGWYGDERNEQAFCGDRDCWDGAGAHRDLALDSNRADSSHESVKEIIFKQAESADDEISREGGPYRHPGGACGS